MVAANADRFADFFFPVYKRYLDEEDNDLRLITNKKLAEACRPITVEMFSLAQLGTVLLQGSCSGLQWSRERGLRSLSLASGKEQ